MIDLQELVNKSVPLKFNGAELRLELSHALFSSYDVDVGTRLLLKTVARDPALARSSRILDEGCGVGVIGLAVAKAFPGASLLLRDRDSLAAAFAERNRLVNKLRNTTEWLDPPSGERRPPRPAPRVELGLLAAGYGGRRFDYVLSNLPAKAGAPVLEAFFAQAGGSGDRPSFLAPGGRLAVVIVHTLAEAAAGWIEKAGLELVQTGRGSMHRVFVVERGEGFGPAAAIDKGGAAPAGPLEPGAGAGREAAEGMNAAGNSDAADGPYLDLEGLDLSAYLRRQGRFELGKASYQARGFWGLPEFDTTSFGNDAAAELGERLLSDGASRDVLILNPGVGHLALWAVRRLRPAAITGASRDLLSLAATAANLAASGGVAYRAADALRLDELPECSQDLLVETPDIAPSFDWIALSWERAGRLVRPGGVYMAICQPTELGRLEKRRPSGWRLLGERRRRGAEAVAWRRS